MRLLFAIPHFFDHAPGVLRRHGSLGPDPAPRIRALTECLTSIQQLFSVQQCVIDIARKATRPANRQGEITADVIVCTSGKRHLIDQLGLGPGYFTHHQTDSEPRLLGFECHAVLRNRIEVGYDYYCFLEDDLVLRDPQFFTKLHWFSEQFGDDALLMPNRYEVGLNRSVQKAYVDGPIRPGASAEFQNVEECPEVEANVLGQRVAFRRSSNPHSGSFFLNAAQMAAWVAKPYFLDRDTRFIGPLESAASLGVMKSFRIYKPAEENASFLEIEHAGTRFLNRIAPPVRVSGVGAGSPMHILFVHQNYPAQFGHIASRLSQQSGYRCTFVTRKPPAAGPVERIQYKLRGGATKANHPCTRSFENAVHHSLAVYAAMKARPDIRPDLIVGHSGFGSTLYLRQLYPNTPIINYFEYF